jgi:Ni/Co efflux regulator RcnB
MTRIVSLSMLAAVLALSLSSSFAQAEEEHRRCTWVRKCHWEHDHKHCESEKVCRDRH